LIFDQLKKLFGKKPKSEFAFEAGNKGPLSLKSMFNPQSWDYMVKQMLEIPDPDKVLRKAGVSQVGIRKTYL
jgi:hypothetical protein